ncbi:hypothetical protein LINGRAHAP2_LOCUS11343 [Linum grandiflorum]
MFIKELSRTRTWSMSVSFSSLEVVLLNGTLTFGCLMRCRKFESFLILLCV